MSPISFKERAGRALGAMEKIGLSRTFISPILKHLLKTYNNEWDFIEAENYRLLADQAFEQQEAQANTKPSANGPVTRARKATNSGAADVFEHWGDSRSSPRRGLIESPAQVSAPNFNEGKPNSVSKTEAAEPLPFHAAEAIDYHSRISVRMKSIDQNGHFDGCQGASGVNLARKTSSASPAAEREKGKSILAVSRENNRLVSEPPKQPPRTDERGDTDIPQHVHLELKPLEPLPAPECIETVLSKGVGELIIPSQGRVENGIIVASAVQESDQQQPEIMAHVQLKEQTLPITRVDDLGDGNDSVAPIYFKELLENDCFPDLNFNKSENGCRPDHIGDIVGRVNPCPQKQIGDKTEILPLQPSVHLQVVPIDTSPVFEELPAQHPLTITKGSSVELALDTAFEEDISNGIMSLVDSESEVEPPECTVHITDGCDLPWLPEKATEIVKLDEPDIQFLGETRPKFTLCHSLNPNFKRGFIEPEDVGRPKRQKCVQSSGPLSTVRMRRKLTASSCPSSEETRCRERKLKRVKLELFTEDEKEVIGSIREEQTKSIKTSHDPADISRGTEKIPIPFVNNYTSETITQNFKYIPKNVVLQHAYINISLARIGDEDCCSVCVGDCLTAPHSCACTREMGGEFAYTSNGLLKPAYIQYELDRSQDAELKLKSMTYCQTAWDCPIERAKNDLEPDACKGHPLRKFVKECWHKCGCSMQCGNRVVQRGISYKLQVFFTNNGKGWGICTTEDLPAGAFVCEYVGEIMTNMELDERNQDMKKADKYSGSTNHKDTYPVLLDGDWCSERGLKDEEALCLDATIYGNVARFINHRCFDANLIDVPVTIESQDRHYYHVAFFTNRAVTAGEELTWDYKIDFEDEEHPIEAFHCLCNSELCRGGPARTRKHK